MAWIQAPSWPAEIGEHADHAEAVALMSIDLPMDMDRLQDPWDHEPAEICFDRARALWDA